MEIGSFNIHKIRLELGLFKTKKEKLQFLFETKSTLHRIIKSFESEKMVNLRYYARDEMNIEGNTVELREFLRKVIMKYTYNIKDSRYPGEDILSRAVSEELIRYEQFDKLLDIEIQFIQKECAEELKSA